MKRLTKFAIVGALNTAVDFAVFSFLLFQMHMPALLANTAAYGVAVTNSFLLNKLWTFQDRTKGRANIRQAALFLGFNLIGLGLANCTILLLIDHMPALLAKAASVCITFGWNYWSNQKFVYRPQP